MQELEVIRKLEAGNINGPKSASQALYEGSIPIAQARCDLHAIPVGRSRRPHAGVAVT